MNKSNLKEIFADDPEMLRVLEQREQTDLLKRIASKNSFEGIETIKGQKGDKGDTPSDEHLTELIVSLIPDPIAGKDGESIQGPKGEDGKDGKSIMGPRGPKGEMGESIIGPKGEDGKSATTLEVISAILGLKGKEAEDFGKRIGSMIDISQIRNAQSFMFNGKRIKFEELLHGGGSSSGTSSGYQVPTGKVNGINQIFTFTTAPNAIILDGGSLNAVQQDGTVNWTGTTVITLAVAPNFNIYAVA